MYSGSLLNGLISTFLKLSYNSDSAVQRSFSIHTKKGLNCSKVYWLLDTVFGSSIIKLTADKKSLFIDVKANSTIENWTKNKTFKST